MALATSKQLSNPLGSAVKWEGQFENKLKLTIKSTLGVLQMDWSHVWRLKILLKRPAPLDSVGMGPDIKTDFLQAVKKLKKGH